MNINRYEKQIGEETLIIENGKLAKQAGGSVCVQYGATVVLVTAVMSDEPREGLNFLPLTVEYQERTYAAGRIPGGFFKREGRPSEKEILSARLIDRPIRPLFPQGLINDIQIVATVLSSDGTYDPDILAVIGASCALEISDIPFNGPIAAVRLSYIDGKFTVFPTYEQVEAAQMNLTVAATEKGVIMMEADASEVPRDAAEAAIKNAKPYLDEIIELQKKIKSEIGIAKSQPILTEKNEDLIKQVESLIKDKLNELPGRKKKEEVSNFINILLSELTAELITDESEITKADIKDALDEVVKKYLRKYIIDNKKRIDGRLPEDIRDIFCQAPVLPRTHGSGLFTRGQTQSLAVVTLGTAADEQRMEELSGEKSKNFMLHYNFPPFSVGETRPMRGPGRREIGHGALAEKALKPIMPSREDFPYTVRVVSDILESNGSSSMASVCAGSLALMDAGVPLKEAVSGIAMGLIKDGKTEVILTDIAGLEDHFGDMDFKVAGTKSGITAIQVDLKIDGISLESITRIFNQAEEARLKILDKMKEAISEPRPNLSEYAPRITTLRVPTAKIGEIIGPSGKTIRKIISDTGVSIDIDDDGTVLIASTDRESSQKAIKIIEALVEEPEVGRIYKGKVARIENFGAFVEILPGKSGLVHVSELSKEFVKNVSDVVSIGDELIVKLTDIDNLGRLNLSAKDVSDEEKNQVKD